MIREGTRVSVGGGTVGCSLARWAIGGHGGTTPPAAIRRVARKAQCADRHDDGFLSASCVVLMFPVSVRRAARHSRKGIAVIEIPLGRGYTALIDDQDEEVVRAHKWRVLVQRHTAYAIARLPRKNGRQRTLYMHRLILGAEPGQWVMHVDRDGINNTRANLRTRATSRKPA